MAPPNQKLIFLITPGEFAKLPHLHCVATEWVDSPSYYYDYERFNSHELSASHSLLKYTVDGYGYISYGGTTYKVDRGKAFILPRKVSNAFFYYPPKETKPWSFIDCDFCNLGEAVEQLNSRYGPVYDLGEESFVMKKILALVNRPKQEGTMVSSSDSFGFCAEIIEEMCRIVELKDNQANGPLAIKARNLIYNQRMQNFSLPELSMRLGVSPEHLCREFKKQLHETPKHYHDKLRMKLICERLINTALPIKEIVTEFDFKSIANFNAFFKKHSAMTPGQFRQGGHNVFF